MMFIFAILYPTVLGKQNIIKYICGLHLTFVTVEAGKCYKCPSHGSDSTLCSLPANQTSDCPDEAGCGMGSFYRF